MRRIAGLDEIATEFDAVVTDQYGVLHDGSTPFPSALAAMEALHARGCPIVALTNSGKRAATNAARLASLGFPPDLFAAVISSGELARKRLEDLPPGTAVHLITRDGETELLDGLDLPQVGPDQAAALVVLAGIRPATTSRSAYNAALEARAKNRIPLLLVNPDTLMIEAGSVMFGAGAIAEDYAKAGGPVEPLGKPAPEMFEAALQIIGATPPDRVLMIGDSPEHDIAGARNLGFQTLLVEGGVQAGLDGPPADYVIDQLRWATTGDG